MGLWAWLFGLTEEAQLRRAAKTGDTDRVRVILEHATDLGEAVQSALIPALKNGHIQVAELLIENGADPRLTNKSGSTPLHLAVQNTGRSDSGSAAAKDEQRRIIAVLHEHGAR